MLYQTFMKIDQKKMELQFIEVVNRNLKKKMGLDKKLENFLKKDKGLWQIFKYHRQILNSLNIKDISLKLLRKKSL